MRVCVLKTLYNLSVCSAIVLSLMLVGSIWHLGANSMIACGFLGAFFIHAGARPKFRHLLAAGLAGTGFAASYLMFGGRFGPSTLVALIGAGAFLGSGSLAVMSCHMVWTGSQGYKIALRDALVLPVFSLVAGVLMNLVNGGAKSSYDYFLQAFDSTLGSPGHIVAGWFKTFPWLATAASITYSSLLIFPPLYHGWAGYRGVRGGMHLMNAFVIAGIGGFVLYQICPAIGPLYCFKGQFPDRLPGIDGLNLQSFSSTEVHNAMPSMHMTWALLVWWSSWRLGRLAIAIASGFVGLTVLAMLGFGEHYAIDLVVSVPLVMMVEGICTNSRKLTLAGAAMVAGWMLYLRLGLTLHVPAAVNWALVAATLAVAVTMQLDIQRAWSAMRNTSGFRLQTSGHVTSTN